MKTFLARLSIRLSNSCHHLNIIRKYCTNNPLWHAKVTDTIILHTPLYTSTYSYDYTYEDIFCASLSPDPEISYKKTLQNLHNHTHAWYTHQFTLVHTICFLQPTVSIRSIPKTWIIFPWSNQKQVDSNKNSKFIWPYKLCKCYLPSKGIHYLYSPLVLLKVPLNLLFYSNTFLHWPALLFVASCNCASCILFFDTLFTSITTLAKTEECYVILLRITKTILFWENIEWDTIFE